MKWVTATALAAVAIGLVVVFAVESPDAPARQPDPSAQLPATMPRAFRQTVEPQAPPLERNVVLVSRTARERAFREFDRVLPIGWVNFSSRERDALYTALIDASFALEAAADACEQEADLLEQMQCRRTLSEALVEDVQNAVAAELAHRRLSTEDLNSVLSTVGFIASAWLHDGFQAKGATPAELVRVAQMP